MPDRDKYGHYVNDKGVTIKINTDRNGNDHISFYDKDVDDDHSAVHVNINYDDDSWTSYYHNEDDSEKSEGSGGCYLTTACMEHQLQYFDDNCEELTVLRWFRDNFVTKEDIDHYYTVAPSVVEAINESEHSKEVYDYIYNNVVLECVNAIKKGDYEFAYNRYKSSMLSLEEQFGRKYLIQRLVKALK